MTSFRKIFSDTAIPVAGKFFSLLISIVLIKLLSTNLGVDGFGYYITIFEFLALFIAIADFGIYATSVKEMAGCDKETATHVLGNTIGMRLMMAVISITAAVIIVLLIPDYQGTPVVAGVCLATTIVILRSTTDGLKAVLQVHYKIRYGTLAALLGKIARLCWIVFVIAIFVPSDISYLGLGATASVGWLDSSTRTSVIYLVVAGFTFGSLVEFLITYRYARDYQTLSIRFDPVYWRAFLHKTFPYAIAIFLGQAYFRADILMLSLLEGPESVGIYAVAMRLVENGAFISVVFVNALLPSLVMELREQNYTKAEALLNKSWLLLVSVSLPIVLLASMFSVPLTLFLSSHDYVSGTLQKYGSDVAIQISVWALLFSFLNKLLIYTTLAMGKQAKILWVNAVGVTINIALNLIFIPRFGLVAAAVTTVVSELAVLSVSFFIVKRELHFHPPWLQSAGVILSAIIVFGATYVVLSLAWSTKSIFAMLLIGPISCIGYFWVLKTTVLRTYLDNLPLTGWCR